MNFLLPKEAGLELDEDTLNSGNNQNDIYRPTGLNQVFYDNGEKVKKRKHISISKLEHILEDLKDDSDLENSDDDLPKEEKIDKSANCLAIKKIKEREEYEENTFTRKVLSKKQKKIEQKLALGHYIDPEIEGEEIMRLLNDEDKTEDNFRKRIKSKCKRKHQKGLKKRFKFKK